MDIGPDVENNHFKRADLILNFFKQFDDEFFFAGINPEWMTDTTGRPDFGRKVV